jgi:glycosyltransferase involved in cell wall biosynthesis
VGARGFRDAPGCLVSRVLDRPDERVPAERAAHPRRILCPTYWYPSHAADTHATYVHDINRHLALRGHRVVVVTPRFGSAAPREAFDGVEIVRFDVAIPEDLTYGKVAQSRVGPAAKLKRIVAMGRYLQLQRRAAIRAGKALGAELVHAHWAIPTGPAAVLAARALGIPCIITMHGGDVYVNAAQGYDFPTRWYVKPILRRTLRDAAALTAITDDCRQHALRAGADDAKIHVIENGADLRRFRPALVSEPAAARDFGPHMIFACRQLFPRKGIRFLIQAAARLKPRFPDLKVVLAGDGFERPDLEALARQLGIGGDTVFLGWVANAELPAYYRASAVSVVPSLEEGFGIPAAEAMGCGVPVVASDAGGLPEVVEDGVTGRIVPKGDAEALAQAIGGLLADEPLRRRMGAAALERARRLFDWDIAARRFEALYEALLAPARGRA